MAGGVTHPHRVFTSTGPKKVKPAAVRRSADVSPEDVQDPGKLSRMLMELRQRQDDINSARRQTIDFEDVSCTSGTDVVLEHGFGCRVRWWVVDWSGSAGPNLRKDTANTTADKLVLDCGQTGTATIRVETV